MAYSIYRYTLSLLCVEHMSYDGYRLTLADSYLPKSAIPTELGPDASIIIYASANNCLGLSILKLGEYCNKG
ncbi:uncharacterized protein RCC_03438 [Ramularia collo-cygni]|uniref:Uncharacterized protein n=1 Tax=Ramularia collo-cygni TaxID=112498 RepID=A0A2D3UNH6_9PEZI|nr:LOW QUALITY PROTEIN: uncharacterized protein RCC_03438 [Ramularia collo-cygni]CZT17602.1 uncharacterized protein RCC_03438 [Ramularia collo-cygni]